MPVEVLPTWSNNRVYRADITFDNGQVYTTYTTSNDDTRGILLNLRVNESNAITSGNPVGIVSPNSCNLLIWDKSKSLIPTNKQSPYYGYMRNGVKVNLYFTDTVGSAWIPFGEYYTEDWNAARKNGMFEAANLSCTDKLSYIGNKEIPKLSAYAGVDAKDLLREIFLAIGLTESDFSIDASLTLSIVYSIAKGSKLREVLNSISQSLIARITLDRRGVIRVIPAFPPVDVKYTLDSSSMSNFTVSHNRTSVYNKVRVSYNKVDNRPSDVLLDLTVDVKPGVNEYNNLEISSNVLSIDGVYLDCGATSEADADKTEYINYQANQGGIDVQIKSKMTSTFTANITVEGRSAGHTDAYVECDVTGNDPTIVDTKVANTLFIESYVIQSENAANEYARNVADYLHSMEQQISISGVLSPVLTTGMHVDIKTGDVALDGTYLVTDFNIMVGDRYGTDATLVKIRGL